MGTEQGRLHPMTTNRARRRLLSLAAGVTLGALTLTACSDPGTEPDPTASATSAPTTTDEGEPDVRDILARGLEPLSAATARLVADPTTDVTEVELDFLDRWRVADVLGHGAHPTRLFVAWTADGEVRVLTGRPEEFSAVLEDDRVDVADEATAEAVAAAFLDTTRTFRQLSYPVRSVDDIRWLPTLDEAGTAARDAVLTGFRERVGPPVAAPDGSAWAVEAWTVDGSTLVRHVVRIGSDLTVTDSPTVEASDLPVPVSP